MVKLQSIPQRHQLSIRMDAPLWDDQQVDFENDLQTIEYLYPGKLVWVNEENSWFYYIKTEIKTQPNGDEYNFLVWKRQYVRTKIESYTTGKNYIEGETVWCKGKIYNALKDINQFPSPPNTPVIPYEDKDNNYWAVICGDTEVVKYEFDEMSSFIIQSDIKEPIFQCWIEDTDGKLIQVVPSIELIDDHEFEFSFWEWDFDNKNYQPKKRSGYISFK